MHLYEDTGVPTHEYNIALPGGLRGKAIGLEGHHNEYRIRVDLVQKRRRQVALELLRRARETKCKATARQRARRNTSISIKRQRQQPSDKSSTRAHMETAAQLAQNKTRWQEVM
jgi:hypothetical protein